MLAPIKILFLLPLLKYFGCYGNLKIPLTYNGKNENWHLLLFHCRYFDESLSGPLPNIYFLSKPLNWIGVKATSGLNLFKNQLLRSYMGEKAETLQKCS